MLADVGVYNIQTLFSLGAAQTYARVKQRGRNPSHNLLWALEGAIRNIPWQEVARNNHLELLLQVEDVGKIEPAYQPNNLGINPQVERLWADLGVCVKVVQARNLPMFAEPDNLVEAEVNRSGRSIQLIPEAAVAWVALKSAAEIDGAEMYLISGYRSIERQAELIQEKLDRGEEITNILQVLAPPGCSEHHSGCAVDIGAPGYAGLEEAFEKSGTFRWLENNAHRFGFILSFPRDNPWGYQYEPWHWCYRRL